MFDMNGQPFADPSQEQMNFIFKYYPEYSTDAYTILTWLYNVAVQKEMQYQ